MTAVNSEGEEQPQMTPKGSTTNGDEATQKESPVEYMIPKGLYVWGDVGTGKSMLMDLFFEVCIMNRLHFDLHPCSLLLSPCQVFDGEKKAPCTFSSIYA